MLHCHTLYRRKSSQYLTKPTFHQRGLSIASWPELVLCASIKNESSCLLSHSSEKKSFCYLPRRANLVVWHFSAFVVVFPPFHEEASEPSNINMDEQEGARKKLPWGISCGEGVLHARFSCVKASELSKEKPWKKLKVTSESQVTCSAS